LKHFERKDYSHRLAYVGDIFSHINEINLSIRDLKSPLWMLSRN
jgi:hypothetical protein